jgi:hypothetical protein
MIRKGKKTVDFVIKCTIIYLAAVLGSWIMITCGFITPWREKFMLIEWKLFSFMILNSLSHYQKIDKYKRKYWGNIPRELPWEKKLKQSKKNDDVSFLPTELPTEYASYADGKIPSVKLLNLVVSTVHLSLNSMLNKIKFS